MYLIIGSMNSKTSRIHPLGKKQLSFSLGIVIKIQGVQYQVSVKIAFDFVSVKIVIERYLVGRL